MLFLKAMAHYVKALFSKLRKFADQFVNNAFDWIQSGKQRLSGNGGPLFASFVPVLLHRLLARCQHTEP